MRTTHWLFGALVAFGASLLLPACGSSSKGGGAAPASDAGEASTVGPGDAAVETAAPEAGDDEGGAEAGLAGYPAFPPAMAQLSKQTGPTLTAPHIITITWASDTSASTYQAFDDAIGASDYWKSLAEYGIGPATSTTADHVSVTTAPPSPWDTYAIDQWTEQQIQGAPGNGWPVPDAQSIYIVYPPSSVPVTSGGTDACQSVGGYHEALNPSNATSKHGVAYALVLTSCYSEYGLSLADNATSTASHELAEAATDPYPFTAGWDGFDANSIGWDLWNEWQVIGTVPEIADACEFFFDWDYVGTGDLPYSLSRVWSNASASAGHSPCVPAPAGAYTNVTPLGLTSIDVRAPDYTNTLTPFTTQGWRVTPGTPATFNVGFNSDAPSGSWEVQTYEGDCCGNTTNYLTISPASFTGKNGDSVPVTITVNSMPPNDVTAILLTFWSATGKHNNVMPVLIGAY